jgi:hypothetical protein
MNTKKKYVLIAERSREDVALRLSFAAKKINEKKNYTPLVIYDHRPTSECYKIYDTFKINQIYKYNKILSFFDNLKIFFYSVIFFAYSFLLIWIKGLDWFVYNYKIKKILVGDLIYDRYIRTDNKYLSPSLFDFKFLKLLFFGILKVNFVSKIFDLYEIKYSLVGSKSYISISAIVLRVSLSRNKKSIFISGYGYKIYSKIDNFIEPLRDAVVKFKKKIRKNKLKKESANYYKKKINGELNSNKRKGIIFDDEKYWKDFKEDHKFNNLILKKKKKYSKIIVFASHCFSEINHYTGDIIFRDYFQQFIETLKFAKNNPSHLWIFKLHPKCNEKYNELRSTLKVLSDNYSENILVPPIKFSNKSLFNYVDLVVSTRGTMCAEAATFGINNIMTTENFFTGFGFTTVKKNKKEYFDSFNKKVTFKKLSSKSINTAKEILYLSKTIYRNSPYNIFPVRRLLSKIQFTKKLKQISTKSDKNLDKLYNDMLIKFL